MPTSTLVMTDGTAASSKAIELAGYAGGPLLRTHDGTQLILVHAWQHTPATALGLDTGSSSEAGPAAMATAPGAHSRASTPGAPSGASPLAVGAAVGGGAPAPPLTVEAATRAATGAATSSLESLLAVMQKGSGEATSTTTATATATAAGGGAGAIAAEGRAKVPVRAAEQQLPAVFVMQRALQTIHESKALREGLNYKVETSVLPLGEGASTGEEGTAEAVPVSPRTKGGGPIAGKQRATAGRAAPPPQQQQQQQRSHSTDKEAGAANTPASAGAGARVEDAAVAAEEAAEEQRRRRARLIVAYGAGRAAHHGVRAITLGVGSTYEGKTVVAGSVAREALRALKDRYLLCYVKAEGFTLRPSTAAVRYVVVVPLASGGAAMDGAASHNSGLQHSCAAVSFALSCCRAGSKDRVTVLLAVEPDMEGGGAGEEAAAASGGAHTVTESSVAAYTTCLTRVIEGHASHAPQGGATAAAAEPVGGDAPSESGATAVAAAEEPLISVCTLKPVKNCPTPTFANAAGQVAKAVQQRKPEMVVVSASAPEALQLALLGIPRPHCLVVPTHYA